MTKIDVRCATTEDLPGVLALYRHLNPADPAVDAATLAGAWSAIQESGNVRVLIAAVGGELIASCMLAIIPNLTRGARPFGVIENVVTHPAHRRRGHGRSVLNAAISAAWEANCYKVMLATGSSRPEMLRFYEGAGFKAGGKTLFEIRRP